MINTIRKAYRPSSSSIPKPDKESYSKKEALLDKRIREYLDKYSGVNLHLELRSDEKYMTEYRKAKALLDLISVLAKERGKKDIENDFVKKRL